VAQPNESSGGVELAPGVFAPESAVEVRYVRARGPGGQNVNKVSTAAEVRIMLSAVTGLNDRARARLVEALGSRLTEAGDILIHCDEHRSQERNREEALGRLREMIVRARIEPKVRRRTKPSRGSQMRRMDAKRHRGQIKSGRRATFD
jgi:ribosome-associated protein